MIRRSEEAYAYRYGKYEAIFFSHTQRRDSDGNGVTGEEGMHVGREGTERHVYTAEYRHSVGKTWYTHVKA